MFENWLIALAVLCWPYPIAMVMGHIGNKYEDGSKPFAFWNTFATILMFGWPGLLIAYFTVMGIIELLRGY